MVNEKINLPIALVSFTAGEQGLALIEKLGVQEKFQRKGYGKRLLNYVLTILKARGVAKVSLISTPEARSFYKKTGFYYWRRRFV